MTRPLHTLPPGTRGVVHEVLGGHGLRRRLGAVGVHPGDAVQVVQAAPTGGPVLIEIHGARVALGRRQAERVAIELPDAR